MANIAWALAIESIDRPALRDLRKQLLLYKYQYIIIDTPPTKKKKTQSDYQGFRFKYPNSILDPESPHSDYCGPYFIF